MSWQGFISWRRGWAGSGRTLGWVLLVISCACAIFVALAKAAVIGQQRSHGVIAERTSAVEDRALRITSLTATADPLVGLIVTATFKGDIERNLGQGHLARGLLGLILTPKAIGQPKIGVLDAGGGISGIHAPILRRQGRRVTAGSRLIVVFGAERVQPMTATRPVEVIRAHNRVIFYFGGTGATNVARLELKAFASAPGPAAGAGHNRPASVWRAVVRSGSTDRASLNVNPSKLTCERLTGTRAELSDVLASDLARELGREQQTQNVLRAAIGRSGSGRVVSTVQAPGPASLTRALALTARKIGQLHSQIVGLNRLIARVDSLLKACAPAQAPNTATPATALAPPTTTTSAPPPVQVVQTDSTLGQQLTPQPSLGMTSSSPQGVPVIDVNEQVRYQQFSGLGGAMTDSSAWLLQNDLPTADRAALMQDLFGSAGAPGGLGAPPIHLNFLRFAMGASGAMTVRPPYSYDDMPQGQTDPALTDFSATDPGTTSASYLIPTLQQAVGINPRLELLANPWSPPGWMKTNDSLSNQNDQGTLLTQYYGALASYFVKVIQAYAGQGLPIAAITPQNEPRSGSDAGTFYPGLTLPESAEAQFIIHDLAPALSAAGLHPKIYGNDLSWDQFSQYANPLATGPAAADLTGIAWHCYFGSPNVMTQLHQSAPALDQIVDECSPEIRAFGTPEFLVSNLRNWASVAAVWSIVLDPNGQPIQPNNNCGGCRGLVSIDQQSHAVTFRTEYYQVGQISGYVQPGAWRVDSPNFVTYGVNKSNIETVSSGLDDVAFLNPDGSKVLVVNNNSGMPITFGVQSDGRYFTYTIPPQAMTTFVWR